MSKLVRVPEYGRFQANVIPYLSQNHKTQIDYELKNIKEQIL